MNVELYILGVGVDMVATARVQDSVERFGDRFLNRCYLPGEIAYCQQMKFPAQHFAARFAAKEAIAKAFGTGIGEHLGWKDMEIRRRPSGEPFVVLYGKGIELARERGVRQVLVSLSHCKEYAVANAVIVGSLPRPE
jgi:holo-[acyl-carrier protein] synthase